MDILLLERGRYSAITTKLKFGGKVEFDIWELLLCQRKRVAGIGEEYVTTVLIDSHIGVLTALKVGELLGIIALDPAGLMD